MSCSVDADVGCLGLSSHVDALLHGEQARANQLPRQAQSNGAQALKKGLPSLVDAGSSLAQALLNVAPEAEIQMHPLRGPHRQSPSFNFLPLLLFNRFARLNTPLGPPSSTTRNLRLLPQVLHNTWPKAFIWVETDCRTWSPVHRRCSH